MIIELLDYGVFFKIIILAIQFLYVVFGFLITRQTALLNDSFQTPYKRMFSFIALIHFVLSISVFGLSILTF